MLRSAVRKSPADRSLSTRDDLCFAQELSRRCSTSSASEAYSCLEVLELTTIRVCSQAHLCLPCTSLVHLSVSRILLPTVAQLDRSRLEHRSPLPDWQRHARRLRLVHRSLFGARHGSRQAIAQQAVPIHKRIDACVLGAQVRTRSRADVERALMVYAAGSVWALAAIADRVLLKGESISSRVPCSSR